MKNYIYRPTFNARVYGAAEKRADEYWKKRKGRSNILTHKCPYLGCSEIIPLNQQYCDKHKAAYDQEIRHGADKQFNDFYHSREWIKTQGIVMMKFHGLCVYSYIMEHKVVQADAIHHIIELREDWNKRLSVSNLVPLSATVHDGVIRSLYLESEESKRKAQQMLFECLRKFNEEFGGNNVWR